MADSNARLIDTTKIRKAVQSYIPLSITTYTLPHEMELYMADVLSVFLQETKQEHMQEYLTYCLNELVSNAKKANTKRVYFAERNLDINNAADYELGMKTFKTETLENIKYYLTLQKQQGLYIKFIIQTNGEHIKLEVHNNCPLTVFEYKRIHDKIARAQQYSSVDEAFAQILDDSEGAGLGLIIMILMLRKIGLTEENFQVVSENGVTIERIILPLDAKIREHLAEFSKELVPYIEDLPQFPENINRINNLLNDPNSNLSDIAQHISDDVSLTADLLRLVNSAAFSLGTPCRSITDAVKMVGIRGIRNLLYSVGSMQNLNNTDPKQKQLWEHSYRVAFYSFTLSKIHYGSNHAVVDDAYVCGLLHDMGKVVFSEAHPQVIERYRAAQKERTLDEKLLEVISSGTNHTEIGAQIAEKWSFPNVIVQTIRYHHTPDEAPKDIQPVVNVVYFANMLADFRDGMVEYYQFGEKQLKMFKISSEDQLAGLVNHLESLFKKEG